MDTRKRISNSRCAGRTRSDSEHRQVVEAIGRKIVAQIAESGPSTNRTTIDEVQRVPDLLRVIKKSVDSDRRAGRFLLTGSANILTLPQVSESLAGRMEIVSLLPLSRAEIRGKKPGFLG